jgi:two-component system LytT family response regulator
MNKKIKTLIVEDDVVSNTLFKTQLNTYFKDIEVVGLVTNTEELINFLLKDSFDLIFLDIDLGGEKNTLDILSEINDLDAEIIIISSHETHAVKVFNQKRFSSYLLKPASILDLKQAIETAVLKINDKKGLLLQTDNGGQFSESLIAITSGADTTIIKMEEILYLEADGRHTIFTLDDNSKLISLRNLGVYEKILSKSSFYRIHHKYIVHIKKIVSINRSEGAYCRLVNDDSLSISKRRLEALRKFLHL